MKCIYYLFLNEKQVRETIRDAVASIKVPYSPLDYSLDYYIKIERKDKGLNIECLMYLSNDLDDLEAFDLENNSMKEIYMAYKQKELNLVYYNMGEEYIKACMLNELKKWKRTAKFMEFPYININIRGEINENLNCLITASKTEICPDLEQKILATKQEYVDNINDLKVKKYRYKKESRNK